MKDENKHIDFDLLIAKELAEGLTPHEKQLLDAWKAESESNLQYAQQMQKVWAAADGEPIWKPNATEVEDAWQKVKTKSFTKNKVIRLPQYLAVAASFALVVSIIWWLNKPPVATDVLFAVTTTQTDTVLLADGSEVILYPHSKLSYPEKFDALKRNVELVGSGFFSVESNKEWPFKIKTGGSVVEVLGTQFFVNQEKDSVFVKVEEGVVSLYSDITNPEDTTKKIKITKGLSAFKKADKAPVMVDFKKEAEEKLKEETIIYSDFLFEAESLENVLQDLEKTFGVRFIVDDTKFLNCQYSAKFTGAKLDDVLEALELIFDLNFERDENVLFVTGDGC